MGRLTGKQSVTIRRPMIEVWINIWDWTNGQVKESVDITDSLMLYQFQKTIKTPLGTCVLTIVPLVQSNPPNKLVHAMDRFNVMDVVRIYEFGVLKFQGYIKRIAANGSIAPDGKPVRNVMIQATHMGGLFAEGEIGWLLVSQRMLGANFTSVEGKAASFVTKVCQLYDTSNLKFGTLLSTLVDEWFNFLGEMGVTTFRQYLKTYLNYTDGTGADAFDDEVIWPKSPAFFYEAQNGDVSFWGEMQKMMEVPFNEIFFDEGPRSVTIKTSEVTLGEDTTYLIGRPTPFNGRIKSGVTLDYFNQLPLQTIPLSHLIRWDLNKMTDEAYSMYVVNPDYLGLTEFTLKAMGDVKVDTDALNKYLCRTLTAELFYDRKVEKMKTELIQNQQNIEDFVKDNITTLYNWFKDNDKSLNGAITMHVPSENDICIGSRIDIEGINGEFYVEGLSHTWQYGGAVVSSLNVTRGWGKDNQPIQLTDAIFIGGGFLSDKSIR